MRKVISILVILLAPLSGNADVVGTITHLVGDSYLLSFTGDTTRVTFTLHDSRPEIIDQFRVGDRPDGPPVATDPDLGAGNNDARSKFISFNVPLVAWMELDGGPQIIDVPAPTLSVQGGAPSTFALQGDGSWSVTLVTTPSPTKQVEVTWNNATTMEDGTNIPATGPMALGRTTVRYGTCNPGRTIIDRVIGDIFVAAPANTLMVPLVVAQEFCLDAYHSLVQATSFGPGLENNSVLSNVVYVTPVLDQPPVNPEPPGVLTVDSQQLIAYGVQMSVNRMSPFPVGTLPEGTNCDSSQEILGMYVVDRDLVNWAGRAQPLLVIAACRF